MRYLRTFESYNEDTLIVVDVQKSFKKFFSEMYLNELKKYCRNFNKVYQIWDNHSDGRNIDKDYLDSLKKELLFLADQQRLK